MSSIEIFPLQYKHLEDAAALVVTRYKTERAVDYSLPSQFEDINTVIPLLKDYVNGQAGIVAICERRLIGFMIGLPIKVRQTKTAYIPDWGHAADLEDSRIIYQAMYTNLASRWVMDGYYNHIVTFLAHERNEIEAWFSLGFGMIEVDAIRDVTPVEGQTTEFEIRRARPEDIDTVLILRQALEQYLTESPIFISIIRPRGRNFYEKWLQDSANASWLAYRGKEAAALIELTPSNRGGVLMPVTNKNTVNIIGVFTKENLRQSGIATTLLNHSLEWAQSVGYKRCAVEFESTNIIGSSFWYRKGFKPVCYSLLRHIDERITSIDEW